VNFFGIQSIFFSLSFSLSLCFSSLRVAVVDAPTRSSPRYSRRCIILLRTILLNITEATCFNILYLPSNVRAPPFRLKKKRLDDAIRWEQRSDYIWKLCTGIMSAKISY